MSRTGTSGFRIVVVGGGSAYTGEFLMQLLATRDLPVDRVVLVDLPAGRERMDMIRAFGERVAHQAHRRIEIVAELAQDPPRYFDGADFVLTQYRVGGLLARSLDEHIPMAHGVVGQETVGPGGFAKALRTVPVAVEMAEAIRAWAPDAWILNFTNPSGVITEAVHRAAGPRVIGLCNGPYIARKTVAQAMGVDVARVAVDVLGLNHLSFARVWLDGRDVTPAVLGLDPNLDPALRARPDLPANQFGVALMSQVGRLPSSYLRYYWQPEQALAEQRQAVAAGQGTRADQIRALEPEIFAAYADADNMELPAGLAQRGGAYYSTVAMELVAALANNQAVESVVNVPNQTVLPELPPDAVIEVSALVDGRGARPLAVGPLPPAVAGLVQQVKAYERLTIEAALTGSRSLALAALLNNPLVPSVSVAEALLEDLLQAHANHLPRFHR